MIPLCEPQICGDEWKYIKECLDTGWVSSVGSYVNLFEERFKSYLDVKSSIVTMNGTSAILLALQTLGIKPGDEVIVPSMTFIASVNPILYVGATPVFSDITADTWVMDVEKVEELITKKTKAIIPVHIYGNVVQMDKLLKLANKYGLYIIEDATESLGSEYIDDDGLLHKTGTLGHFGTFSFNGNKLITTGAGGMLVTNDYELGEKAKYLSNQAKTNLPNGGFYHEEVGYNYRMPNLLAAMGVAQLEKIDEFIQIKKKNANLYIDLLKNIEGIKLPTVRKNVKHCQWLFSVLVEDKFKVKRNELIFGLKEKDISSRPFFLPIHQMTPYIDFKSDSLYNTNYVSEMGINLPSSVGLNDEQIYYICNSIKEINL